jgi:hypothetical protein
MAGMNWNWFGWIGLLSLCLFLSFLAFPHKIINLVLPYEAAMPYKSALLLLAMISSIVCPVIASIRSSKWWLLLSLCGVLSALRFFWILTA